MHIWQAEKSRGPRREWRILDTMRWPALLVLVACSYEPGVSTLADPDPDTQTCSGTGIEVCNDIDDDCDGVVDEGFSAGMPCDGDDSDSCMDGVLRCDGSCAETGQAKVEICNGAVDDDCNGVTDCADPACTQGEFCCTGTGRIHTIRNSCNSDFGTSGSSDEVEVYCCDGQARFCLSNESCPWRSGCPAGNTKTCSRGGLLADLMATATCDLWKGQTSYSCNADEQITFP